MAKKSNYLLWLSATCHKWTVFFNCSELLLITQNRYLNPSHILQLKSKIWTQSTRLKKSPPRPGYSAGSALWRSKRLILSPPGRSKVCRLITQLLHSDPSNYQSNHKAVWAIAEKKSTQLLPTDTLSLTNGHFKKPHKQIYLKNYLLKNLKM